jgi:ABC-2 type transport system ATP-binding protein
MSVVNKNAVIVKGINKTFRLPHEQHSGIKQKIVNSIKGVRGYDIQKVLTDISFEIKKGEFFGIVGRNGSGKSTLLKILAGIYVPDSGKVTINGSLTPFIELGVGFNPELTGRENIYLNGALLGFSQSQVDDMYDSIVDFAELAKFMDQKLKNYSSGMQVRLAFSIAIKADTDILLFDEVLAVGDENFQKKCLNVFRDLKAQGKTIILVSHSTGDIEKFCDRVLVLDKAEQLGVFKAREAVSLYQEINFESPKKENNKVQQKGKRWGTDNISIDNINIGDSNSRSWTEEPLVVTIALKSKKAEDKARPIRVGLGIYDDMGNYLCGPNSNNDGLHFPAKVKKFEVTYTVPQNILNKGGYKLTVGIFNENESETYDYWIDATTFDVMSDKEYFGRVILNGNWQ